MSYQLLEAAIPIVLPARFTAAPLVVAMLVTGASAQSQSALTQSTVYTVLLRNVAFSRRWWRAGVTLFVVIVMLVARTPVGYAQQIRLPDANTSGPVDQALGDSLRARALRAINAFEYWSYATIPPGSTGTYDGLIRCEPSVALNACFPGTVPPCIYCIGGWLDPRASTLHTSAGGLLLAEQRMMATIDSAARLRPGDDMLVGTRVYLLVKRGRHTDALAAATKPQCLAEGQLCSLWRMFVLQSAGESHIADSLLNNVWTQLSPDARCALRDASFLTEDENRSQYDRLSCSEREARDSVLWWLSDPSFLVPGNDRWTEHIARAVGNDILRRYRDVLQSIGGVWWLAWRLPASDSLENFVDPEKQESGIQRDRIEFTRDSTKAYPPWRWHHELTRFGIPNAIEVFGSDYLNSRYLVKFDRGVCYPGKSNLRADAICTPMVVEIKCPSGSQRWSVGSYGYVMGLDPPGRTGISSSDKAMLPPQPPPHLKWDIWGRSCTRIYNTNARYQFTPDSRAVANPFSAPATSWQLVHESGVFGGPPAREQYSPPYGPVSAIDEFQIARFPRGDSLLVVAAANVPALGQLHATRTAEWEAALIITDHVPPLPNGLAVLRTPRAPLRPKYVFTTYAPSSSLFAAIEVLTPDTLGFARMRVGMPISPWLSSRSKLSDLLLFHPDSTMLSAVDALPKSIEAALPHASGTTSLTVGQPFGIYWELTADRNGNPVTEFDISLHLTSLDEVKRGLFGRVAAAIFGAAKPDARSAVWKIPFAGALLRDGAPSGNAVIVDTRGLPVGRYRMTLTASAPGHPSVTTEGNFVLLGRQNPLEPSPR